MTRSIAGVIFPLVLVVLSVGQNVHDVNESGFIVNADDQPIVVTFDAETVK